MFFGGQSLRYPLSALGVSAGHAGETSVLVCHVLLSALWTLALRLRAVLDILFECALYAVFPRVDVLAVEMQTVDERNDLLDRHVVAQYARNQFGVVPETLVEQTRDAADGVGVAVTVGVLEVVTLRAVLLTDFQYVSVSDFRRDEHRILLDFTREYLVRATFVQPDERNPVLRAVLEPHHVRRNRFRTLVLSRCRFALRGGLLLALLY